MSLKKDSNCKSWAAINLILHNGLKKYKPKNSKLIQLNKDVHNTNKTGSIAVFRNKLAMSRDMGFVVTSEEGLLENIESLTHWTPNIYNWLGYDRNRKHIRGHAERNLSQINTFVVDIDLKNAHDRDQNLKLVTDSIVLDDHILPTLVLKTDKGYQVYYILERPAFLAKHKNGSMPVLSASRKIADNIKHVIKAKMPAVDVGCNSFGIFRIPREDNIIFFEPDLVYPFAGFLAWSQEISQKNHQKQKTALKVVHNNNQVGYRKQTDQAWFKIMLTKRNIMPGQGLGRHNTILTLALACYSSGKSQADTYDLLDEFNSYLKNPIDVRDMDRCVRDAFSGNYKGAAKLYIDELIDTWGTSAEKRIVRQESQVQWYKYAKKRSERKYSHVDEWLEDLINLIKQKSSGKDNVSLSTRAIRDTLNISAASLNRVIQRAIRTNKLVVKKGKGRQASQLATLAMALSALVSEKKKTKAQWINYIQERLSIKPRLFVQLQNLFDSDNLEEIRIDSDVGSSGFNTG